MARASGSAGLRHGGGPSLWTILTCPEDRDLQDPAESVRRDVMAHLNTLLSARRGRCMGHPEFGLSDVTELWFTPRGLARITREVKQLIERWEPRIVAPIDVKVETTPRSKTDKGEGVMRATLVINARLAAPWNDLCTFRTMVLADGTVTDGVTR